MFRQRAGPVLPRQGAAGDEAPGQGGACAPEEAAQPGDVDADDQCHEAQGDVEDCPGEDSTAGGSGTQHEVS